MKERMDLRKAHFQLGCDPKDYTTTKALQFSEINVFLHDHNFYSLMNLLVPLEQ